MNDPIGFSFKLQEYFSPAVLDLDFLSPFALVIAIVLVVFEVVIGIMLLIGYLPKFTVWSLLLMIIFFTFLTFYSAYFDKVKDCGCFGDAIPLTPWQSFYKDLLLLILVLVLFFNRKYITPFLVPASHRWIIFLTFMLSFIFVYYVLMHLPLVDFRAYKIGTNIPEKMRTPEGAEKAVYNYRWTFEQAGEEVIIENSGAYPQVDGKFIKVETEMESEGYKPPIPDFLIERNGVNVTEEVLNEDKVLLIISYNLRSSESDGFRNAKELSERAKKSGYKVIGLTSSGKDRQQEVLKKFGLDMEFLQADETVLKTIVRANPGILTLEKGTITQKVHWGDASEIDL